MLYELRSLAPVAPFEQVSLAPQEAKRRHAHIQTVHSFGIWRYMGICSPKPGSGGEKSSDLEHNVLRKRQWFM